MSPPPVVKKGQFYSITDDGDHYTMEDRTKRGLTVRERSIDEGLGAEAEMGMIHDMDGIGHRIPIRWFFPKGGSVLDEITAHALAMEKKYADMRELTCPDD
ncbi:hypothetical protein CENSYa_1379 [Cenarchaeum symbiosum A]|uniref:Uncharacterized protein n=1 Tax=Cenarchaeum symbiosum (strain A) TaxID=414004 RepID=A0RXD5_CENSY|nr:hypothetical protein CENSYa_1379 [Cenarchaeum symbiosum A]